MWPAGSSRYYASSVPRLADRTRRVLERRFGRAGKLPLAGRGAAGGTISQFRARGENVSGRSAAGGSNPNFFRRRHEAMQPLR
jgi:hypothetical protein